MSSPLDVEDLRSRVRKVLDEVIARQTAALESVDAHLAPLIEAVADLTSGGKRLRPAFCYWGWRGAGGPADGEPGASIVRAATGLELFQAAALIHDDVMDDSDTRRGMPAVHRRFAEMHRASAWLGSPERFGQAAAILVGDLCLSWSDELLVGSGMPVAALDRGRPVFNQMRTELMGGQYLDVLAQTMANEGADDVEWVRQVIHFKSAKYTVEHPLLLGGALAGASDDLLDSYSAYGLPLGEAFQLRDDVNGVFGDPEKTGKPAGDDLREGKRTMLIAIAMRNGSHADQAVVRRHLGDPHLSSSNVGVLRRVIEDTGALTEVEARISSLVAESQRALDVAPLTQPTRRVLGDLITAATVRPG